MKLIKKLKQLLSGANSRTEARTEQSEWARKTMRSVEVTVETDEAAFYHGADSLSKKLHSSDESIGGVKQR